MIASAVNASGAIHFLSLFNVTAPGLDLCLFKKKKEREKKKSTRAACLAAFNVFVLSFPNVKRARQMNRRG